MFIRKFSVMNEAQENGGGGTPLQEYSNLPTSQSDYHAIAEMVMGKSAGQSEAKADEPKATVDDALAFLKGEPKGKELKTPDPVKGKDKEVDADEVETSSDAKDVEQSEEMEELLYKGEIKAVTKSEAKKYAQMGLDYTQKMQALAEERKAKDMEYTKKVSEYEAKLNDFEQRSSQFQQAIEQKEQFDLAIDVIQDTDPEFFDQLKVKMAEAIRHFNNPMIRRQFDALKSKQQEIDSKLETFEVNKIRNGWESDLKSTQSQFADKLSALGVFPDWNGKVKEAYANGASTVQEALMVAHGGDITKAYESKLKLDQVQKRTSRTTPTMNKSTNSAQRSAKIDPTKLSYQQIAEYGLKHHA